MSKKKSTEEFQKELDQIFGNNSFEVLSEYITNQIKIKLKCNKCGNIIYKQPVKMVSGKEGCYICSGKNKHKTTQSFIKEVEDRYPNKYEVLGEYIKAREPLLVKNLFCGHKYLISPDNLLRGKGCPRCSMKQSSYMDIVEDFLSSNNISFEKEKRFEDCKLIRTLPFDYYIPEKNCCIEVDGEFHFYRNQEPLNRRSRTDEVQKRDKIKDLYCQENGIKLVRLPYFRKKDFCNILASELQVNTEITA